MLAWPREPSVSHYGEFKGGLDKSCVQGSTAAANPGSNPGMDAKGAPRAHTWGPEIKEPGSREMSEVHANVGQCRS